jgi:DNA end-binding protein Ku
MTKRQKVVEKTISVEVAKEAVLPEIPAPKSVFKMPIVFGLVNVPVRAVTMRRDTAIHGRYVRRSDGERLATQRIAVKDKQVVDKEDTTLGYDDGEGGMVIIEKNEMKAVMPDSSKKITIEGFTNIFRLDPIYFDNSYILLPDESQEGYGILLAALLESGAAAIGRVTIRNHEHIALIYNYKGALVMTFLLYSEEIILPEQLAELKAVPVPNENAVRIATSIMASMETNLDFRSIKDGTNDIIRNLIQRKKRGEKIVAKGVIKKADAGMMAALEATARTMKIKAPKGK